MLRIVIKKMKTKQKYNLKFLTCNVADLSRIAIN